MFTSWSFSLRYNRSERLAGSPACQTVMQVSIVSYTNNDLIVSGNMSTTVQQIQELDRPIYHSIQKIFGTTFTKLWTFIF